MTGISAGGCGCEPRGGPGTGCSCGRVSAADVVHDGAFTRPSFFEGQLLTADDLQALTGYGRGKDRLHNRYLIGSGVVCGLEVVCSCADRGSVLVRAGYALDCCGNDIVVACDQQVDINELVRSLPHDAGCADPCPPPTKGGKENGNGEAGDAGVAANGTKKDGASTQPRRYELVVEYAETPAELLAPYSTGEETSRACEPTRVREGYRFALRCAPDKPVRPPTLMGALVCCAEAEEKLAKLEKATTIAYGLAGGGTAAALAAPSSEDLDRAEQQLRASPGLPQAARLAGMAVQFAVAGDQESAERALLVVRETSGLVHDALGNDPLAAAEAAALDERVASLSGRLRELRPTRADLLLAEGVVSGDQVGGTLSSLVAEARDWALCWLEQRPGTHCRSVESLAGMTVPADDGEALRDAAVKVTSAVRQILIDCVCAAVNPPCAPCEDDALVLAVVAVDRCEVVEICNQARRHAITGTALRYWMPIEWLYCEIEKACCGDADKVKVLAQARGVLRDLAAPTDCGWPKRWMQTGYEPVAESDDEANGLPARVADLERELALLRQQRPQGSAEDSIDAHPPEERSAEEAATTKKAATTRKSSSERRGATGNANG